MRETNQEFTQRVAQIPFHGIGLSVDVYSPDVFELTDQLDDRGIPYGYLEIFKADQSALEKVRSRRPSVSLEYHADGLWVTQPDWMTAYPYEDELNKVMMDLRSLDCSWLNQECATKQIGGHSFGTYLPPLFTKSSAQVTASNVEFAQRYLDGQSKSGFDHSPLFLLETPPLTYFSLGDISYAEFFRMIADNCSCGFVLDIGHIWTVYRYTSACEYGSIEQFLGKFLGMFPLERVVQIHIAGLDFHPAVPQDYKGNQGQPNWIDAHQAPIPSVLFNMLEQVLCREELVNIKGLAMEVDMKSIELILEELAELLKRFGRWGKSLELASMSSVNAQQESDCPRRPPNDGPRKDQELEQCYRQYVRMITGQRSEDSLALDAENLFDAKDLAHYSKRYLPYEILVWGGDLKEMFPKTLESLESSGKGLKNFLEFWYAHPQGVCEPYDFFLLKVRYFVEYIRAEYPQFASQAVNEAIDLRKGYALACQVSSSQDSV